jgi:hypothetical protein
MTNNNQNFNLKKPVTNPLVLISLKRIKATIKLTSKAETWNKSFGSNALHVHAAVVKGPKFSVDFITTIQREAVNQI